MKRNVVHYVTKQYMKQNRKRTRITFLGIVFMVLLMTCVFVGKDTAVQYLEEVASQKDGKWHIAFYDITGGQRDEILAQEGIKEAAVSANYGITEFAQSANTDRPYLNVKAYQQPCFDWMNIKIKDGRLPERSGEIVISEAAIEDGARLEIGDTITAEYFTRSITGINPEVEGTFFPFYNLTVRYGETTGVSQNFPYYGENDSFEEVRDYTGKKQEYQIVGIIEVPGFEESGAAAYTAITALEDSEIEQLGKFNLSLILDLKNPVVNDIEYGMTLTDIVKGEESQIEYNDYVLGFSAESSDSTINILVIFLTVFFTGLILFVSVVLIYNVFNISFEERSWYLGMLSSVGATGRQKRSSIYYEAFYLLMFALPLGILAGLGVVKLGMLGIQPFMIKMLALGPYIENTSVTLVVSGKALLAILVLSVVTVLFSAFLPARKVSKIGPIECIRGNTDQKNRSYRMSRKSCKRGHAERMLAGNAIKRQAKKTRAVTAAAVSFMVILGVTAFGENAIVKAVKIKIGTSGTRIESKWDYVLVPYEAAPLEYEALKEEIMKADGIAEAVEWYDGIYVGSVPSDCLSEEYWDAVHDIFRLYGVDESDFRTHKRSSQSVSVTGVDEKTLEKIAALTGSDLDKLNHGETPGAIVIKGGELSTSNFYFEWREAERYRYYEIGQMTGKNIGEEMPISLYSPEKEDVVDFPVEVAGYLSADQAEDFGWLQDAYLQLIVSVDTAKQMRSILSEGNENRDEAFGTGIDPAIYIRLSEENPEILQKLLRLDGDSYIFVATDIETSMGDAIIAIVNVLLICFVLLSSVICLFNLFNSIRGRINERSREFATLESVGMTGEQIGKMLLYESMGIVAKSIIYAVVIAGILCYLIQYGMIKIFGAMRIGFPWLLMAGAVAVTVLVVAGLTLYCYRKRKPETILERIRRESV